MVRRENFVSGGRTIRTDVFLPPGDGRHPAVIVLHSAAGTLVGRRELEDFSRRLAAEGAVVFFPRYFDRTGTAYANGRAIDRLSRVWLETVGDAVDYVTAHPRVRPERIGLFGYSLGGYLAVAQGSRDPRVDAVAEVAGGIFEGWEPQMRRQPALLILHGRDDTVVPVARAAELASAARRLGRPAEVRIYPGQGHRLTGAAATDATGRALGFLRRELRLRRP